MRKFGLSIIFIVFLINICGCYGKGRETFLKPLPQDEFIQVYFNYNQAKGAEYIEPYRKLKRRGDNLEEIIINQINSANSTIDLAVQELNLPNIAQALVDRYQAGIKVRVIIDNTYNVPVNKLYPNSDALVILKKAHIPLLDDTEDGSKGSGLMHHKFIIIDNHKIITGSANFTFSGIHGDLNNLQTRGNTNHILVIDNWQLAHIFTKEFNWMWGDGVGGKKDSLFGLKKPDHLPKNIQIGNTSLTVKFSPTSKSKTWAQSTNGLIAQTLKYSFNSIDLALFVFSDQEIANTLEKIHEKKVQIRALIDKSFAFQYYSEGLDLLGVALPRGCSYEENNHPWQKPINSVGISNLFEGDKLHHKFAIIDDLTVITGSHNWSASANHNNDETLLIIDNPTVAKHFKREFERLYHNSALGIPLYVNQKIKDAQKKCQKIQ